MGIRSWWQRRQLDEEDFSEEIRAHLSIAAEERVTDGETPEAARYAALREFGNVTRATEAARAVWTPHWLEAAGDWLNDVRYAVRSLTRNPVFSLTVIGVLTLGIGLNAAVFTMLKSFTLSPVAGVEGSASIAVIYGRTTTGRDVRLSYPDYLVLSDNHSGFIDLFGTIPATVSLGRGRDGRQVWSELVTGNYFRALGIGPQIGRTLLPGDDTAPGGQPVAAISDTLWRREFNADPAIVGRAIHINGQALTVVGVLDPAFHGSVVSYDVEVFIPITTAPQLGFYFGSAETTTAEVLADRTTEVFFPMGRLRPGVTMAAAQSQANGLWTNPLLDRQDHGSEVSLAVVPFWRMPSSAPVIVLPTLTVLSGMGLLVLVIACANIAGLVIVRGVSRRGELAVRLALGAARRRILRLLVIENLVLAAPGAALGLLLARWLLPMLVREAERLAAPQRVFFNIDADGWVLLFVSLVGCGSALVFGVLPSIRSTRVDLVTVINEDASPRGAGRSRVRSALVVAQVAVSFLLLAGSGLATRSVQAVRAIDLGFDPRQVASIHLDLKLNGYDRTRGAAFYNQLLAAARTGTGVESATLAAFVPVAFLDRRAQPFEVDGSVSPDGADLAVVSNAVDSDYFLTLRTPVLSGREFDDRDTDAGQPVAVVNRTFADRFLGGAGAAIGRRVRLAGGAWREVVGVAADLKYSRVDETPRPYLYVPLSQSYRTVAVLHVRGAGSVDALLDGARAQIAALDPGLPILAARPMTDSLRGALIFYDLIAAALSIFGFAGLALAAMGTYGLVSYGVRQSTREIGIRVALGASAASVIRSFVVRALRLGAAGAVLGIVGALAVGGLLERVLFGLSGPDLPSLARALMVVLSGVALASLVPAWRGARSSPLRALRHH